MLRKRQENQCTVEPLEARLQMAAHILGSPTAYSTIQAAVNAALAGSTITVDAGTYPEQVTINKTLTIRGAQAGQDGRGATRRSAPAAESIVTGGLSNGVRTAAFYINANDVTLDGFTVQGETDSSEQTGAGIVVAPSHAGTHILNNVVQNNVSGLFLANNSSTDSALIQYNYFGYNNNAGTDGGRGIYSDGTISGGNLTNVTIDSNSFIHNFGGSATTGLEGACAFEALLAGQQSNIRITNNLMDGNGKAVLFFNTTNIVIEGNTVINTLDQYSGSLRFEGNVNNVNISYNLAHDNPGPAVSIDSKGVPGDNYAFAVNNNNFYNNNRVYATRISVIYNAANYVGILDARNNWWGNASGPSGNGTGTGDAASAGTMQMGTGLGWALAPGGNLTFSPWSTALISLPAGLPAAPAALTAVSPSPTQVKLSWTDNAAGVETGFIVQRSLDNQTYSQVALLAAGVTTFTDSVSASSTDYYRVIATSAGGNSLPSTSLSISTVPALAVTTYMSDLAWASATTGYGTIGKNMTISGNAIALRGATYAKGLGTHAASQIVYNLNGQYSNFVSDVGVDDEINGRGLGFVDFQVIGDGVLLYDSGTVTNASPTAHISVNVAGVKQLTLLATNGVPGSIDFDHADWAGAALVAQQQVPPAPSAVIAAALSSSQISLTWTATGANLTGLQIDRSTDGVNFTTLAASVAPSATSYTDGSLAAGTVYYYRVRAVNAVGASPNSAPASVATLSASAITTYLSDLPWASATTGYGTVGKDVTVNGNRITLRGSTYAKGLGAHAVSQIVYNLNGQYSTFVTDVGLDDEIVGKGVGSADFQVIGDGKVLFDSGIVTSASPVVHISVSVAGVTQLTLLASNGIPGSIDFDHVDWAGASLLASQQAPPAPANLSAAALSSTQVSLSWTASGVNLTGFQIDRSTDGVTFATVATGLAPAATFYTDGSLAAGTTYTYRVRAMNAAGTSPNSAPATVATLANSTVTTYLSDLPWVSATTGYGTVGRNATVSGNPIVLRGTTYAKGLGAHAVSQIVYNLGGQYSTFISDIGIDDEVNSKGSGSVDFQVMGDGKVLFDSGVLTSASPAVHVSVSVVGVKQLTLLASNGVAGSIDYDHTDWAGASLLAPAQAPTAPAGVSAAALSASQIAVTWANTSTHQTSLEIDRSTDDVTFTTIAINIAPTATACTDGSVLPGTTYYYRVRAVNAVGPSPNSAEAHATTLAASATLTYLSDLVAASATTGFGSIGKDTTVNGNAITLRGTTYAKGLGVHAVSQIAYNLNAQYSTFLSDIGVDDEVNGKGVGSVDFQILGDGKVLFDSGVLTNASPIVHVNINVAGISQLTLVATNGVAGSIDFDHADWAGARLA